MCESKNRFIHMGLLLGDIVEVFFFLCPKFGTSKNTMEYMEFSMVTSTISWVWKCKIGVCFRLLLFDRSTFCFERVFLRVIGGLVKWGLGNLMVSSKGIFGGVWEWTSLQPRRILIPFFCGKYPDY